MTSNDCTAQRIIFVGTLSWNKGPQYLIDAIKPISEECPHVRLIMLGDGPLRTNLQKQAEKLQVADRIEFMGNLTTVQVAEYYRKADICMIPSLFETFSMVACEAMLHSLPIVASRRGSLPELVVDGETGLLVEPTDPHSIAAAVLRLLRNPDEARRLGRNGYDRAQRLYSLDAYLRNLADVVRLAQVREEKAL